MSGSDLGAEEASATDGTPANPYDGRDAIPWERAGRHVSRLQTRVSAAETEGRREETRRLQRAPTHSFDARLLAARTVTADRGRKAPGADMVAWDAPEARLAAAKSPRAGDTGPSR